MKKIFDFKKIVLLVLIQIVCGIFLFAEETTEEKNSQFRLLILHQKMDRLFWQFIIHQKIMIRE